MKLFPIIFLALFMTDGLLKAAISSSSRSSRFSSQKVEKKMTKLPKDQSIASSVAVDQTNVKFPSSVGVPGIEIIAKQAILIDEQTGAVLLENNADELMHPSSMTKIMTACLAVEKIKKGIIKPETLVTIGPQSWKIEGSSMFLNLNDQVSVLDLLKGIIIQSGNDASIALAHYISGSEQAFASEMTQRAHDFGATQTQFVNATGLPHDRHKTTARDLIKIARHVIHDDREFYSLYGEKTFTYKGITQGNRNPLLYKNLGSDGIKTGYCEVGGYGLVGTCVVQGRRYLFVINGLASMAERSKESSKLIEWASQNFTNCSLFKPGDGVVDISVWNGEEDNLKLTVEKDAIFTIPYGGKQDLKVKVIYESFVAAPILKGKVLGKIIVTSQFLPQPIEFPLVAASGVKKAHFFKRLKQSFSYIVGMHPIK